MLAGEKLSENDYGNCNGALDFDSRNTTETMTDEGPLICGFNATYRGPHPSNSKNISRLMLLGTIVRFFLVPATNHGSRLSCCRARDAMHAPTMCDGRWIQGIACDAVSMYQ
jgi:hypothetical protein